ncbi:MAG TPA: hypothetical protein VLQ93_20330 [Myxococcaceae bacterium]|nr:hypothetical protein [Myxococcaceae bacterium]
MNELEEENRKWKESWQERLPLQLFVFGGETGLAQYFATVPALADGKGRQPVVEVNVYEEPYALPIASDVDRFLRAGRFAPLLGDDEVREWVGQVSNV